MTEDEEAIEAFRKLLEVALMEALCGKPVSDEAIARSEEIVRSRVTILDELLPDPDGDM